MADLILSGKLSIELINQIKELIELEVNPLKKRIQELEKLVEIELKKVKPDKQM